MMFGFKYILADHLYRNYFDLGIGLHLHGSPPEQLSYIEILRCVTEVCSTRNAEAHKRIANRINDFIRSSSQFGLEIISDFSPEYRAVTDLGYDFKGTRYDLSPAHIEIQPLNISDIMPPLEPEEQIACHALAVKLYVKRTGLPLTYAYEAVRAYRSTKSYLAL